MQQEGGEQLATVYNPSMYQLVVYNASLQYPTPPVHEGMSKEEISALTTVTLGYQSDLDDCSICSDQFMGGDRQKILVCSHKFHEVCIDQWLANKSSCPMCRRKLK